MAAIHDVAKENVIYYYAQNPYVSGLGIYFKSRERKKPRKMEQKKYIYIKKLRITRRRKVFCGVKTQSRFTHSPRIDV